jgi:outer membrane protein assembly factor BamB
LLIIVLASLGVVSLRASRNAPKLLWQATLIPGGVGSNAIPPTKLTLYGADALLGSGLWFDPIIYGFDGKVRWRFATPHRGTAGCTAVSGDGKLYVGTTKNEVYAFDPQGKLSWVFPATGTKVWSCCPAVGPDGTVYVTASDGVLYAVTPEGKQKWRVEIDALSGRRPPVVAADGTVYASSRHQELIAISPDGKEKWRTPPESMSADPLFVGDLLVCDCRSLGLVNAFNKDGTLAWEYDAQADLTGEDVVGPDGTVYVLAESRLQRGSNKGQLLPPSKLLAMGTDGKLRWKYTTVSGDPFACLGATSDGRIVLFEPTLSQGGPLSLDSLMQDLSYRLAGHFFAGLVVLNGDGAIERSYEIPILLTMAAPIALPGNRMLFLGEDGVLYCYQL